MTKIRAALARLWAFAVLAFRLLPSPPEACVLAGVGLVSYGAWRVYPPAGFIVLGVLLLVGGLVGWARGRPPEARNG